MNRHRRKSGPWFWIGTFLVGLFSTERGKRRIGRQMAELQAGIDSRDRRISDLEYVRDSLIEELAQVTAGHNSPPGPRIPETPESSPGSDEKPLADTDSETTANLPTPLLTSTVAECDNLKLTPSAS